MKKNLIWWTCINAEKRKELEEYLPHYVVVLQGTVCSVIFALMIRRKIKKICEFIMIKLSGKFRTG